MNSRFSFFHSKKPIAKEIPTPNTVIVSDITLDKLNASFEEAYLNYQKGILKAEFNVATYLKTFGASDRKLGIHCVSDDVLANLIFTFIKDKEFNNSRHKISYECCQKTVNGMLSRLTKNVLANKTKSDCYHSLKDISTHLKEFKSNAPAQHASEVMLQLHKKMGEFLVAENKLKLRK